MKKYLIKAIFCTSMLGGLLAPALSHAKDFSRLELAGVTTGLGQVEPNDVPQIQNLGLNDPLVQETYLQNASLMRFLRATYSEGCAREYISNAARSVVADLNKEHSKEVRDVASLLLSNNRLWKMSSFELEAALGPTYVRASNFCDCAIRDVSTRDLVNPKKAVDALSKLTDNTKRSCEAIANEKTAQQLEERKDFLRKLNK